ncbi:MAG: hypothetical protein ACJA13_001191 [Paraglaciecola sp.]
MSGNLTLLITPFFLLITATGGSYKIRVNSNENNVSTAFSRFIFYLNLRFSNSHTRFTLRCHNNTAPVSVGVQSVTDLNFSFTEAFNRTRILTSFITGEFDKIVVGLHQCSVKIPTKRDFLGLQLLVLHPKTLPFLSAFFTY